MERKLSSTSGLSLSLHHPTYLGTLCMWMGTLERDKGGRSMAVQWRLRTQCSAQGERTVGGVEGNYTLEHLREAG